MPLVVLLVAAALVVWSSRHKAQQQREVQLFVEGLCADVLAGRDLAPRLEATDTLVSSMLVPRLAEVVRRAGGRTERLRVEVSAGDSPSAGSGAGQATHTAAVFIDGQEGLGLRLVHRSDGRPIAIIGFWIPPPT